MGRQGCRVPVEEQSIRDEVRELGGTSSGYLVLIRLRLTSSFIRAWVDSPRLTLVASLEPSLLAYARFLSLLCQLRF